MAGKPAEICPSNAGGVCYSIAVPTFSADAGSGNIYFQIKAPTSFQWVALGTGSAMAGSNIFLMYQDGMGNLTLSPRLGERYSMPRLDSSDTAARLVLLEGSGVSEDGTTMTANVACPNCEKWSGGEMVLSSTSASWIAAWKEGPSLATTDRAATIAQHDGHAQFKVDLTQATVDSDSNPFILRETDGGDGGDGGSSSGPGQGSGSGGIVVTTTSSRGSVLAAHGVIMALVMAVLYPLGSLVMPLVGKWWVHGAWQVIAFCLMWAGFGLGVETARQRDMVSGANQPSACPTSRLTVTQIFTERHTILGTVVVALMAIQPGLGYLHHLQYLKTRRRGVVSYVHIWWGRILMVLGVVNGGLGLHLSSERNSLVVAYSVVAAVTFLCYVLYKSFVVFGRKKKKALRIRHIPANKPIPGMPYQAAGRYGDMYI